MSFLSEPVRPTRRTLCQVLRKSTNWKCLILTILIATCLGAIIWCRNTTITKILLDFDAFPITKRRQVSPCQDGYVYIPIAFVIMLYLLYLVECWHSNARIFLSLEKIDINSVYRKIHDLKESQAVIWWKAICYHYVRRVRQTTSYRNGETLTSSQVYYERVNSNAVGSSFFYNICGMKDYSKELVDLEKHPVTKIRFSKGFVFANISTATEFEEQRATFFREQDRLDDYMEMREGLEFPNIHFNETLVAWTFPECPPWFGRTNVFWLCSFLLLSWPIRILLELNTAHLHYKVTKLFGVNYPSDTDLVQLQRPLLTSNYLHHIQQTSRRQHQQRRPERNHHHHHRTRLARLRSYDTSIEDTSTTSSSPSGVPTFATSTQPLLLPPENAFTNPNFYYTNSNPTSHAMENSRRSQNSHSNASSSFSNINNAARNDEKTFGKDCDSQYQTFKSFNINSNVSGKSSWVQFASSLLRRTLSRNNNNLRNFLPRSITLMVEPSSGRNCSNESNKGYFNHNKRNYSFYSNSMTLDDEENEFLVPSYSEALLLLEPNSSSTGTNDQHNSVQGAAAAVSENSVSVTADSNSISQGPQNNNYCDNDQSEFTHRDHDHHSFLSTSSSSRCVRSDNGSTYHDSHSSCQQHNRQHEHNRNAYDNGSGGDDNGGEGTSLMTAFSSNNASSSSILPAAVEIDLTHSVVSSFPLDPRIETDTSRNHSEISQAVDEEQPPSYIEALRTSRPVFISTFNRLRRCFTERDLAGGITGTSHHNHHQQNAYMRDRIQQTWFNYYYSRNPTFLERFRLPLPIKTSSTNTNNSNN